MTGTCPRRVRRLGAIVLTLLTGALVPVTVQDARAAEPLAPFVIEEVELPSAVDGTRLYLQVGYRRTPGSEIERRPVLIEQSPYAPGFDAANGYWLEGLDDDFTFIFLHQRGTGLSGGSWELSGPNDQSDFRQVIEWACSLERPWSNGHAAINGGSASAIAAYAAMRGPMPCVDTAVLWAGASNPYRDIANPGGIFNAGISAGFTGLVGAGMGRTIAPRAVRDPSSFPAMAEGVAQVAIDAQLHPTEDAFWTERAFSERTAEPTFPILTFTGFWDIQPDAGVEGYLATRHLGSKLRITGAHEGEQTFDGRKDQMRRWLRHHMLAEDNGIDREPAVLAIVPIGGLDEFLRGEVVERVGSDWPLPGTRFTRLFFADGPTGSARSLNDGALGTAPGAGAPDTYLARPSSPYDSDRAFAQATAGGGLALVAPTTDLRNEEPAALTYTSAALTEPLELLGPAVVELFASSAADETDYVVVLADVHPDGTAHQIAQGRIRSTFTGDVPQRALVDRASGEVIRPWADFSVKESVPAGEVRRYGIEVGPVGNRFEVGHRIRVYVLGPPAAATLGRPPTLNTIHHDLLRPSSILLPVVGEAGSRGRPQPRPRPRAPRGDDASMAEVSPDR